MFFSDDGQGQLFLNKRNQKINNTIKNNSWIFFCLFGNNILKRFCIYITILFYLLILGWGGEGERESW